jgi:GT2 family glycosyltransferase
MLKNIDIGLVNYKTPKVTAICLRHLKEIAPLVNKIWVVDNNSQDESTSIIKKQKFVNLIHRKAKDINGKEAHGKALDVIKEKSKSKYLLIMHTDTFIYNADFLKEMTTEFKKEPNLFAIGCLHQIDRGRLRFFYRYVSRLIKFMFRTVVSKVSNKIRAPKNFKEDYIKTFCALYDLEKLKKLKVDFFSNANEVPSNNLQKIMLKKGYQRSIWPASKIFSFMDHVEEATHIETGMNRKRLRRVSRFNAMTK